MPEGASPQSRLVSFHFVIRFEKAKDSKNPRVPGFVLKVLEGSPSISKERGKMNCTSTKKMPDILGVTGRELGVYLKWDTSYGYSPLTTREINKRSTVLQTAKCVTNL